MTTASARRFTHERVVTISGPRSGLAMTVAIASTVLGPAIGGCRVWQYDQWTDGVADAMQLSAAMAMKNAAAGLPFGGGKSVIQLPPGADGMERRRAALLDLGDLIESLHGEYRTGTDVGTTVDDMRVVFERTQHIIGLPTDLGGPGSSSQPTAIGVVASIRSTLQHLTGASTMSGHTFVLNGLGQVGERIARLIVAAGGDLHASDIDERKREVAEQIGARWTSPETSHTIPATIYIPAGVGGSISRTVIDQLAARAVVGPANNPLVDDDGDTLLSERGILYAPDFIVNAGGSIFLSLMSEPGADSAEVTRRIQAIGDTLTTVYQEADREGSTPLEAAKLLASRRLEAGR